MDNKFLVIMLLFLLSGCEADFTAYNSGLAATKSLKYLEMVLIQRKVKESYPEIHQVFKDRMPEDTYIDKLTIIADQLNLQKIEAIRYEHVGGDTGAIHVYLSVNGRPGKGFMQVLLGGDSKNYRVMGFETLDALPEEAIHGGTFGQY